MTAVTTGIRCSVEYGEGFLKPEADLNRKAGRVPKRRRRWFCRALSRWGDRHELVSRTIRERDASRLRIPAICQGRWRRRVYRALALKFCSTPWDDPRRLRSHPGILLACNGSSLQA